MRIRARLVLIAAVCGALLAFPASGWAATIFGSRLNHEPANSGECTAFLACTIVSFIHPTDPNGDPYSGGAPVDGVITKFRIRAFGEGDPATDATVTFRLADITVNPSDPESALATAAGTGPTVTIPGGLSSGDPIPILEFPARLSVKKGNHLALDGTNVWATVNNSGDKFSYVFSPPLVDGQGARGSNIPPGATGELLVQAVIEPDADGDGFGDETQDGCPTNASAQGACPTQPILPLTPPDTVKPTLSSLALSPKVFAVAGGGASAAKGTSIGYRLSESSAVTFTVYRARPGRRVRGRCVKPTRSNATRKRCTRYVKVRGSLARTGAAGPNRLRWSGKLAGKALRVGRYRLNAQARDSAGNRSGVVTAKFRIVK